MLNSELLVSALFIISPGAQKSGTTTLAEILGREHPNLRHPPGFGNRLMYELFTDVNRRKELHFFDELLVDQDWSASAEQLYSAYAVNWNGSNCDSNLCFEA